MTETDIANHALDLLGHTGRLTALDTDTTREARLCRSHFDECRLRLLRSFPWNFAMTRTRLLAVKTAVTTAANNGSGLVRCTSASHGLLDGQRVTISGSGTFDGSWYVTGKTTNTFDLEASTWVATSTFGKWSQAPAFGPAYSIALPSGCLRVIEVAGQRASAKQCTFSVEANRLLVDVDTLTARYIADVESVDAWDPLFRRLFALSLATSLAVPLTQSKTLADSLMAMTQRESADAWQSDALETQSEIIYPEDDSVILSTRQADL